MRAHKHVTKLHYTWNHKWCLITNLHPYDFNYDSTCYFTISSSKPTDRMIRRHKKEASKNKKHTNFDAREYFNSTYTLKGRNV